MTHNFKALCPYKSSRSGPTPLFSSNIPPPPPHWNWGVACVMVHKFSRKRGYFWSVCLGRYPPTSLARGPPSLWKVIGKCRWTGYDFAGHQYWHRVSYRPNVVITIGTGYQIGLMWSSPLTQGIKIGLLGYGRLLRLSQDRMPIVFYDRPAIQAEAMTFFFFFFFFCLSAQHPQSDRILSEEYNILQQGICIWMFLVRYIVTGCIFRAPCAIWQGQVWPPPPAAPPYPVEKSSAPPPPDCHWRLYKYIIYIPTRRCAKMTSGRHPINEDLLYHGITGVARIFQQGSQSEGAKPGGGGGGTHVIW